MASAWGLSWGSSWGNAWGKLAAKVAQGGGGGSFSPPAYFGKPINYQLKHYQVESKPEKVEYTSSYAQSEIDRFQSVIELLRLQIEAAKVEFNIYQSRHELASIEALNKETLRARAFISQLLLDIRQLILMKQRREEEEIFLLMLMGDMI